MKLINILFLTLLSTNCSSFKIDSHYISNSFKPIESLYIKPIAIKGYNDNKLNLNFRKNLSFALSEMNYRIISDNNDKIINKNFHIKTEVFHSEIGSEIDKKLSTSIYIELINTKINKSLFLIRLSMVGIDLRDAINQAKISKKIAQTIDKRIKEKASL